jgi:hypothetical protein
MWRRKGEGEEGFFAESDKRSKILIHLWLPSGLISNLGSQFLKRQFSPMCALRL